MLMHRATFETETVLFDHHMVWNGETKGLLYDTKEKITNKEKAWKVIFLPGLLPWPTPAAEAKVSRVFSFDIWIFA